MWGYDREEKLGPDRWTRRAFVATAGADRVADRVRLLYEGDRNPSRDVALHGAVSFGPTVFPLPPAFSGAADRLLRAVGGCWLNAIAT
jgi:hypothetical protein